MVAQVLSYIFTALGLIGFYLAGKKVWWCWYVNIANQALWTAFALITGYYALLIGSTFYFAVFTKNAYLWTKEHYAKTERPLPEVKLTLNDAQFQQGMKKTKEEDLDRLLPKVDFPTFNKIEHRKGENLMIDGEEVYISSTTPEAIIHHICHASPAPTHGHAIICPTGEHPTGWQHISSAHTTCLICR